MKYFFTILMFLFFVNYSNADTIVINRKLQNLENDIKRIEANQINYKVEKDLLKETYSNNYEKINFFITFVLGLVGIFGFLGLKDISSIKKEYEAELHKLRLIQGEFDLKSKSFDTDKKKFEEELKSIITENEEQSRKIKFIELKEKVKTLIKDNSIATALEFVNVALSIEENDKSLLNQKGMILCRLNQIPEAVAVFKKAHLGNPEDELTLANFVECLFFAKQIEEAKKIISNYKNLFEKKEDGKLLELFNVIDFYVLNKKEELLAVVKGSVNINDLKGKYKYFEHWDLHEAIHFIHFEPESELKKIVKNLFWFYDAQINGESLLKRLDIELPTQYHDFEEFGAEKDPV
jgi:tetratricopeptide (TPR) repeat protein